MKLEIKIIKMPYTVQYALLALKPRCTYYFCEFNKTQINQINVTF
jgi:hypothetical protein